MIEHHKHIQISYMGQKKYLKSTDMGRFCCKNLNIKDVRTRRKGKGNITQQRKQNLGHWLDMAFTVVKQFKLNLIWNFFQNSGNRRHSISKTSISIQLIWIYFFLFFYQLVKYGFGSVSTPPIPFRPWVNCQVQVEQHLWP